MPTGVKLRVATADLCLMSLLCFRSTYNGLECSSSSHHAINLVLLFGICMYVCTYIHVYIYRKVRLMKPTHDSLLETFSLASPFYDLALHLCVLSTI